jgi:type I restriction enzyme R subunit
LEKGGVVWHTQGSGKSLTMVFLIRKIRSCDDLKDLKIIFTIVDRTDLEEQLSDTAEYSQANLVESLTSETNLHLN